MNIFFNALFGTLMIGVVLYQWLPVNCWKKAGQYGQPAKSARWSLITLQAVIVAALVFMILRLGYFAGCSIAFFWRLRKFTLSSQMNSIIFQSGFNWKISCPPHVFV